MWQRGDLDAHRGSLCDLICTGGIFFACVVDFKGKSYITLLLHLPY